MTKFVVASAMALLVSATAHANITIANGDLLFALADTTSGMDLVVDLGSYASNFSSTNGTVAKSWSLDLNPILTAASGQGHTFDLTDGSTWAMLGNGATTSAAKPTYISRVAADNLNPGLQDSANWVVTNLGTTQSQVSSLGGLAKIGSTNVTGLTNAAMFADTLSASLTKQSELNTAFNLVGGQQVFGTTGSGLSTLDLYSITTGSTAFNEFQGSFQLSDAGILTYTAIPEPSTYAMILGALTLGVVAVRRRMVKRV